MSRLIPKQIPRSSVKQTVIVRGVHFGPTRRGWLSRLLCDHEKITRYTRVDHTTWSSKPGIWVDRPTYDGRVCMDCGAILFEEQIL